MNTLKNTTFVTIATFFLSLSLGLPAHAQQPDASQGPIEMNEEPMPSATPGARKSSGGVPVVGRKAAQKYMGPHNAPQESGNSGAREFGSQLSPDDHYLALHIGGFVSDSAYRWGSSQKQDDVGDVNIGLTYRMGEWYRSMDLAIRVDYQTYGLAPGTASKLSFLPLITFPDAASRFPLYFGVGAGLGVFTHQIGSESAISIDYQLLLGARFFDVFRNTGFFIEAGIKNHFLVLSDGQFNGTFVSAGPVFTF